MFKNFLTNKESRNCEEYKAERKIKARTAIANAAFNKKETLFNSKLDLNVRNKVMKCFTCRIALYGAKTWILWKTDQKYFQSFKMWCWGRINSPRYLVNNTTNISNDVYYRITTTCFGLFRPSSGFHPKEY